MIKMDISKFVGDTKPNVEEIEGFELFYDEHINKWSYRPQIGYSDKYISEDQFIPQREKTDKINSKRRNIDSAKENKNDEFYTRFEDISKELNHYRDFFKDKIVYCPCDKAFNKGRSEFVNYFTKVGKEWGIKKVIYTQYNPYGRGYMWELDFRSIESNSILDEHDINTYLLDGNGDFSSSECKEIMRECDIVVTNPPFSLFRKFINQIMELKKQFLIIGNKNAITYKEVYPLIQTNQLWLGYTSPSNFIQPNNHETKTLKALTRWFTNLPHNKRLNDTIDIWKPYVKGEYFFYDNYPGAIECGHYTANGKWEGSVDDIPNYDGIMGVPITFLDIYNPNQFEIVGFRKGLNGKDLVFNGYSPYFRVLIKKKCS
jgi:hypothetical protein